MLKVTTRKHDLVAADHGNDITPLYEDSFTCIGHHRYGTQFLCLIVLGAIEFAWKISGRQTEEGERERERERWKSLHKKPKAS